MKKENLIIIILTFLLAGILVLSYFTYDIYKKVRHVDGILSKQLLNEYLNRRITNIPITKNDIVLGNENAPILFIMYSKYDCVHCKEFFDESFDSLNMNYIQTGKIKFVLKFLSHSEDKVPFFAAKCAVCANQLNTFEQLHHEIEKMTELDTVKIRAIAEEITNDKKAFRLCMNTDSIRKFLIECRTNAKQNGLGGTPTYIINGKLVIGVKSYTYLSRIIENENFNSQEKKTCD
jgi:protein-disulfide isomerase